MGTKRKITQYVKQCPVDFNGYFSEVELNLLPFESYDILVVMEWLEQQAAIINCLKKIATCVGTDGVLMVILMEA